jgi:hypothetical protein
MKQTFFEKWKHRFKDAWLVLTGRAWVGHGNPMQWRFMTPEEIEKERHTLISAEGNKA